MDGKLVVNGKEDDDGDYESTPGTPTEYDSSQQPSFSGERYVL